MKSKAVVLGHPAHPMLIPFPIAFLTGAFLFDAAGWLSGNTTWWTTGGYLAILGVASALLAAVPGVIDYVYTVPPRSTGKSRATKHMLVNLSAVAVFALAWGIRDATAPSMLIVAMELPGIALLMSGGYMGGTLVTRNLISVDHRYAGAGKWREASLEPASGPIPVAKRDELQVDQMKLLRIGDKRIVLARTKEGHVAFDDRCTHRGGSLAGGVMMCGTVQCLWHGSQFDAATGQVKSGPAKEPIRVYDVSEAGDDVRITLP